MLANFVVPISSFMPCSRFPKPSNFRSTMSKQSENEAVQKAQQYDQRPFIQNLALGAGLALSSKVGLQSQWDVLDFGCGTGLVLQRIADNVSTAVGVDSSQGMIHVLSEKKLKHVTACCLQLSSTNTLQKHFDQHAVAASSTFDLIYSSMTLHHLTDVAATVKLLTTYLKPGGLLVAFDLEQGPESMLFHPQPVSPCVHHQGGFASDDLSTVWKGAGLKDVSCEKVHRFTKDVDDNGKPKKVVFWMLMVRGTL